MGVDGVSAYLMKKRHTHRKQRRKPTFLTRRNIVGCRIQHGWKEGNEPVEQWKGTVLEQVSVKPTLYIIKYDGKDSVYGLELHRDKRVLALEILPERVPTPRIDSRLADSLIGKAVGHVFEGEHGTKDEWKGMVLARAPVMDTWFYITYEKDPVLYMYTLLDDYKDGDLRIIQIPTTISLQQNGSLEKLSTALWASRWSTPKMMGPREPAFSSTKLWPSHLSTSLSLMMIFTFMSMVW